MKVLIIGYGSIAKRHEEVLQKFESVTEIHIVTRQTLTDKITFLSLQEVSDLQQYDYVVIASETYKHFNQLVYLEKHLSEKVIFCEKPLFETHREIDICSNKVFVGYVLRFHPLLQKLKIFLEQEHPISAMIDCGQYLPTWRPQSNYRDSYSAHKDQGGGVLLDLSHEIDYAQWLFGPMKEIHSYQTKISDLEIDSDDFVTLISKTDTGVILTLCIDYISKLIHRKMRVNTLENTYELDFINNTLIQKSKEGVEQKFVIEDFERNRMFKQIHLSALDNKDNLCTLTEGLSVMKTISLIQEQNR